MFRLTSLSIAILSSLYTGSVLAAIANTALPTGGQVAHGQAAISQPASNQLQVNQHSQQAVINWQTFNIGKQAGVRFVQPNSQAAVLNRVLNGSTEIAGRLQANGQVFLLNPNGILFSAGAQVNTGGLFAASGSISDAEWLNGHGVVQNSAQGTVVNQGNLTAAQGGRIVLASRNIGNTGRIEAEQGQVQLLAGQSTRLNITADGLIQTELAGGADGAAIAQHGTIQAHGGRVDVLAAGKDSRIVHDGVIEAQGVLEKDGKIYLIAGYEAPGQAPKTGTAVIDGTLDASAPNGGNGGFVETSGGKVSIRDNARVSTKAAAGTNGTWLIDPQDFMIAASGGDISGSTLGSNLSGGNVTILSSSGGTFGEGNIMVNDDVTYTANQLTLTAAKDINVNAIVSVNGTGTLVLNTGTANGADTGVTGGAVSTNGTNGHVFFQNSGDGLLTINGEAYRVINSLGAPGSVTNTDLQGIQSGSGINYALGDDIDASDTATWHGGQGFNPVNLNGQKFNGLGNEISSLTINRPTQDNVGLLGEIIDADIRNLTLSNVAINGQVDVGALLGKSEFGSNTLVNISINGGTVTGSVQGAGGLAGLTNATVRDSIANNVTVTGGEEVGGLIGFLDVGGSLVNGQASGNVSGSNVVGGLIGRATGTGIASALIDNSRASGSVSGIEDVGGLIGELTGFTVDNSSATGNVTGTQRAGGLIGDSNGAVEDSFATGTVTANDSPGLISQDVGGLIGVNVGDLLNVHATGNVSSNSSSATDANVGGLVGQNNSGTISNSYAEGVVTATNGGAVGGLIGRNNGAVTDSYAIGAVTGADGIGGLIGDNDVGTITRSYATGDVTSSTLGAGGLIGFNNVNNIVDSSATGNVTGIELVGGLAGLNEGTITGSFATGTVSGVNNVGGLVGLNDASGGGAATISNSYASGAVSSPLSAGGLVGENTAGGTIIQSYATGSVAGDDVAGGLVGDNEGSITDSYAEGPVAGQLATGGLVGDNNFGIINNSYATGTVQGGQEDTGGLVGSNEGTIQNSHATGNVSGVDSTGGLVGDNLSTIQNSYATGTVTATGDYTGGLTGASDGTITDSHATGAVGGVAYVGGLSGSNENGGIISHSYATGDVTATGYAAGGLVGANSTSDLADPLTGADVSVTGSYATGNVNGTLGVGGLIGANAANLANSTIQHVYATGNVTGQQYVGGLVGANATQGGTSGIDRTYATGLVTGISDVGGLIGENNVVSGSSTVSNSYWNTQTTGQAAAIGTNNGTTSNLTGLTTTQMHQLASFGNFGTHIDAQGGTGTVWRIYEGQTAPLLRQFLTPLTATVTAGGNKVYDGTTNYTDGSFTLSDPAAVLLGTGVLTHLNKNVGVQNVILTGLYSDQQGYDLNVVNGTLTISPAPLDISTSAVSKTYDQTTNAAGTAITVNGTQLFAADSLSGGTFVFDNKNVGSNKTVAVSGVTLNDGNGGNNYTVNFVDNTASSITPATLKVTASGQDRVYDATRAATATYDDDRIAGDVLTVNGTASFADKNAGTNKLVSVSGISLSGADAANYMLDASPVTTTANITPRILTLNAAAQNKVYNGLTAATVSLSDNHLAGDVLTVSGNGNFADKNVGNNKLVTVSGISLSGTDAGNYRLDAAPVTDLASISPASVAINGYKYHDGNAIFNADQLQAYGVFISTPTGGIFERLGLRGHAVAQTADVSSAGHSNVLVNTAGLTLLDGSVAGATNGQAANYVLVDAALGTATYPVTIYPVRTDSHYHQPGVEWVDDSRQYKPQELVLTQPQPVLVNPVDSLLAQNPNLARLETCQENQKFAETPRQCILPEKLVIDAAAEVAEDDGTLATPVQARRALIIANSNYSYPIRPLSGVASDAVVVEATLKAQGYTVSRVENGGREDMIAALNQLIRDSGTDDSVLIYYAGHGYVHEGSSTGYWMPTDADADNPATWLSNSDIARFMKNMAAKQILLVSDSCFSGSLSYESALQREPVLPTNTVLKRRSVVVLTSGSEEPVADVGKNGNGLSPFANVFVDLLARLQPGQELRAQNAYQQIYQQVSGSYRQYPTYGALPSAGHMSGGEYLFVKK